MLVLTRKQNEKIQIGDQITITILRMKGKAVRLGIEAPSDVNVLRGELVFDLAEEAATNPKSAEVTVKENLPSSQPVADNKVRRHGLEIGQATVSDWPVEKQHEQAMSNDSPGRSFAPLAKMVSSRIR